MNCALQRVKLIERGSVARFCPFQIVGDPAQGPPSLLSNQFLSMFSLFNFSYYPLFTRYKTVVGLGPVVIMAMTLNVMVMVMVTIMVMVMVMVKTRKLELLFTERTAAGRTQPTISNVVRSELLSSLSSSSLSSLSSSLLQSTSSLASSS